MKIFYIDPNNTTLLFNYSLIYSLQKRRIDVSFFTSLVNDEKKAEFYHRKFPVEPHYIFFNISNRINNKLFRRFIKVFSYPVILLDLFLKIKKEKPDLIIINWIFSAFYDFYFIKLIQTTGTPVLLNKHNYYQHGRNRLKFFERRIFRVVDKILCLSEYVKNQFDACFRKKISVIEHGNCFEAMISKSPQLAREQSEELKLLFIGSIRRYKGIDILLQAMQVMVKEIENVQLKIVGSGEEDYANFISEFILNNELSEYVDFDNRYVSYSELFGLINACDVGILPYKQGTQSSLPYAFTSFYKPVIVTNSSGLSEQVPSRTSKIVLPSPKAVARAVQEVKHQIDNNQIKKKYFDEYLNNHKWSDTVSRHVDLYYEMINKRVQ